MSMSAIVQTIVGASPSAYTFLLPKASLDSILTTAELSRAIPSYSDANPQKGIGCAFTLTHATQALWATTLTSSAGNIPVDQVKAILAAALIGGGMGAPWAPGEADRIYRAQPITTLQLVADIVNAAIAAG